MTREIAKWIGFASMFSTLIPFVFVLVSRNKQPRQNLILAVSLGISIIFDVIGAALAFNHKPNGISNNLYYILSLPAILWFYHETLSKRSLKILIRVFAVSFVVMACVFAFDSGLNSLNTQIMTLSSILVTVTSFFFVADLNQMDESSFLNNRYHETNIILNTSLALYYFTTIILFAATEYVFSNLKPDDIRIFSSCHNGVQILKNIGITIGFYMCAKRNRS